MQRGGFAPLGALMRLMWEASPRITVYPGGSDGDRRNNKGSTMARGAGGSEGGTGTFILGLIMLVTGGYLLLRGIIVRPAFGFRTVAFTMGGFPVTTGVILIPLLIGVGGIFYDSRRWWGWLLSGAALLALIVGVIANLNIQLISMTLFDFLIILVLIAGGSGLLLRSLKSTKWP